MAEYTFLGNIRGPRGVQGDRGAQGLPGIQAIENDEAVAGYVGTTGTSKTQAAVDGRIAVRTRGRRGRAVRDTATGRPQGRLPW
jgi:hypothetical protein